MANINHSLSHTKWLCKYHVVFTPKYRRKIIYNQYRESLKEIIKTLCGYKGVEIFEYPSKYKYFKLHGIPQRKKCTDDVRSTRQFEI